MKWFEKKLNQNNIKLNYNINIVNFQQRKFIPFQVVSRVDTQTEPYAICLSFKK